jgi:hypothetical protein
MKYIRRYKDLLIGWLIADAVALVLMVYFHITFKKAVFGLFYFMITPFLTIFSYPVSFVVIIILGLLFRRVNTCLRTNLKAFAYAILFLHWMGYGVYASRYINFH